MIAVDWGVGLDDNTIICEATQRLGNVMRLSRQGAKRLDLEGAPGLKAELERRATEDLMYRNHAILDLPRLGEIACQYCGRRDGTIVMAHSNQGAHGKGKGIKAHDCFVAALCHGCHDFVDQSTGMALARATVWEMAHERTLPLFSHLLDDYARQLLAEDA